MPVSRRTGRYDATHLPEAQFEPGSRGKVLRNLLGIKRKREMDEVEAREQLRALRELICVRCGSLSLFMTKVIFLRPLTCAGFIEPG